MGNRLTHTDSELLTVEQMAERHPTLFTCSAVRPANPYSLQAALAEQTPLPVIDAAALKTGASAHECWCMR